MTRIEKLNELERKLRCAVGPELRRLEKEIHQLSREIGFGNRIRELAEATNGMVPVQTLKAQGDGEHVNIWVYSNFQVLVHIVDSPALFGERSRIEKWWKRRCAPQQLHDLIVQTEHMLQKRAAKRRQHLQSAA